MSRPFPVGAIAWKPCAVKGNRALALAFADSRWYLDRLEAVAGPDWSDDYEVQPGGTVVLCRLTIGGVTRTDIGEAELVDHNTATSALAQAFKRACARFGLGRYLYRLPKAWEEYDPQRRCFSDSALQRLQRLVSGGSAPGRTGNDGDLLIPSGEYVGRTLTWLLRHDRRYLQRIANEAKDVELREAAQKLLGNGNGT